MSNSYHCAIAVVIGSITAMTTASLSWWSGDPNSVENGISSGAIILDGKELKSPFHVDIIDEEVLINDQSILKLPPAAMDEPLNLETRHGVIQNALQQYGIKKQTRSENVATTETLSLVQQSNLVERAKVIQSGRIEIQFKGQDHPDVLELADERITPLGPEGRQKLLGKRQLMIQDFLRADCLVVLVDGIVTATEPGTAQERLRLVQQASQPGLPMNERKNAFKEAVGDSLVAILLAQKVADASGKAVQP